MKVSYLLYLFILIFAPLAFGTVELWSYSIVEVATALAAVFFFLSVFVHRKTLYRAPGAVPLLLLLLFMLLQLIPLPASFVRVLSPSTYEAYAPVISMSGSDWIPLTINQKATLQEFLRIACYSLFYILTIQLLSLHGRLEKTVNVVIRLAAAVAFLAIIQQVGSPDKIYWFRSVPVNASPFGPWVNPNQFAGFMEMITPLALGLFLFYKPRVSLHESLRTKVVNFFSLPGSNQYLVLGFAVTLMALSVFVSLCRGGILTITLSLFVFMLLHNMKKSRHGRVAILAIIALVVMAVSWFGWDSVIAEFNHGFASSGDFVDGRFDIWRDSIRIFKAFFLFGSGFGTYSDIFPSFRSFPGYGIIDHAHNDYLELLTDGGIIGFVLAGWFVFEVLRHGWRMIRVRRDQYSVLLGIGTVTGIIAMLLHSTTDFNMHNGADGLYFFFFCGLLVAVVNIRFSYSYTTTLLQEQGRRQNAVYLLAALLLIIVTVIIQYGALRAQTGFRQVEGIYLNRHLKATLVQKLIQEVSKAKRFDPLDYRYEFKLGRVEWFLNNRDKSLNHFIIAARQKPMSGATLQSMGMLVDDEDQAKLLLEKGYQRGLDDDELAATFAGYLLQKGQRDKAVGLLAERLQKNPSLLRKWAAFLEEFSFSREEIVKTLSYSVESLINYGVFLQDRNNLDEAEYYFNSALASIKDKDKVKPYCFRKIIQFFQKNDQPEMAILILRRAVEAIPDDASFHIQLGDYYRKEGIVFRAKEEYQHALMIDPGNKTAIRGLRLMGLRDSYK